MPEPNRINRNSRVRPCHSGQKTIHVHDLLAEVETEYPESKEVRKLLALALSSSHRCFEKAIPSARSIFAVRRCARSPRSRSKLWKRSQTRP